MVTCVETFEKFDACSIYQTAMLIKITGPYRRRVSSINLYVIGVFVGNIQGAVSTIIVIDAGCVNTT
jgi:hypothetical protein